MCTVKIRCVSTIQINFALGTLYVKRLLTVQLISTLPFRLRSLKHTWTVCTVQSFRLTTLVWTVCDLSEG